MNKNIITKNENGTYTLTTFDGKTFTCTRWYEKKKDYWHVLVPKDARDICGRTYIRESYFDNSDIYEFETKTEHREGLGNGGWKTRLTEEELKEYEEHEKRMNELKELALSRPVKELTEEEKILKEMAKLQARLAIVKGRV